MKHYERRKFDKAYYIMLRRILYQFVFLLNPNIYYWVSEYVNIYFCDIYARKTGLTSSLKKKLQLI